MVLEDFLEDEVGREDEDDPGDEGRDGEAEEKVPLPERLDGEPRNGAERKDEQDVQRLDLQQERELGKPRGGAGLGHRHQVRPELVHGGDMAGQQAPEPGNEREDEHDARTDKDPRHEFLRPLEGVADAQDGDQDDDGGIGAEGQGGDEQQDDEPDQGQPPAGQALPVEDEDEAGIDEGGAGLLLAEDDQHRQGDDQGGQDEALDLGYLEVRLAHHDREQQRGRDFRDFGRLEADGAEREPRPRALDFDAEEDDGDKQEGHAGIQPRREPLPPAGGDDEEDEAGEAEGRDDPDELLAAARREIEGGRPVGRMAGGIDIDPADQDQQQVAADQLPVHGLAEPPFGLILQDHLSFFTRPMRFPSFILLSRSFRCVSPVRYFSTIREASGQAQVAPKPPFST